MITINGASRLFMTLVLLCGAVQAAEPEFKFSIVTESRTYERQSGSVSIGGVQAGRTMVSMSRVTVALDGVLVTGEWEPKTLQSTTAKNFRRGTDVLAAVERGRLLLKLPDDSVVTARIVKREKQRPPELDRRTRD